MQQTLEVNQHQHGMRLDQFVAHMMCTSRRLARLCIAQGHVQCNGRVVRILTKPLHAGVAVCVRDMHTQSQTRVLLTQHDILYHDRYIVVVNKPAKLLSEVDRFGSPAVESLLPQLLKPLGGPTTLWLVHRLDAGTSGVMVLARTPMAAANLSMAFRTGLVKKTYVALCKGLLAAPQLIDAPIARLHGVRHGVSKQDNPQARAATTDIAPLASAFDATLVRAMPHTGRTHQIRVHLSHMQLPLYGDKLYGGPVYVNRQPIGRCMLHALQLQFPHPKDASPVSFVAMVPHDFEMLQSDLQISYNFAKDTVACLLPKTNKNY